MAEILCSVCSININIDSPRFHASMKGRCLKFSSPFTWTVPTDREINIFYNLKNLFNTKFLLYILFPWQGLCFFHKVFVLVLVFYLVWKRHMTQSWHTEACVPTLQCPLLNVNNKDLSKTCRWMSVVSEDYKWTVCVVLVIFIMKSMVWNVTVMQTT